MSSSDLDPRENGGAHKPSLKYERHSDGNDWKQCVRSAGLQNRQIASELYRSVPDPFEFRKILHNFRNSFSVGWYGTAARYVERTVLNAAETAFSL